MTNMTAGVLEQPLTTEEVTASYTISHARPTTVSRMKLITEGCLPIAKAAIAAGIDVSNAIVEHTVKANNTRYNKIGKMAKYPSTCSRIMVL